MIRGVHTMFYSSEPDALRAFLRDKLGFPATDIGGGWLIFDLPEADLGCHPTDQEGPTSGTSHISFYCDSIHTTVAELQDRGVEFTGPITEQGWGLLTQFRVPGGFTVQLYEPRYAKPARKAATKPKRAAAKARKVKVKAKPKQVKKKAKRK